MSEIIATIAPDAAQTVTGAAAQAAPRLFDRAIRRIASVWRDMASSVVGEAPNEGIAAQMRDCLAGRGGEVSARNRAARLAETFVKLDTEGRVDFLRTLAAFDSDPEAVSHAARAVQDAIDPAARATATAALRQALEPPRLRLLTQFTTIPDGMKLLVDLRAFLLDHRDADPALRALEADLKGVLAQWFDVGFLQLQRIDWSSPAILLEKLVGYEAVHEIRGWRDLKNRLDSDRRCYAFFHPRMPDEPLIFVEVALVRGLAASVQRLLDQKAPVLDAADADTAIFYSISNCQQGLSGISFGNFLIKRVVELLSAEFRNLKTFATLSPMPGFRRWLNEALATDETTPPLLSDNEQAALLNAAGPADGADGVQLVDGRAALATVLDRRGWQRDPAAVRVLEPILVRLGARYLLAESRGKRARDPVAHFHLSNGARVERISLLADTSEKGVRESASLMVNYLYDLAKIEDNHEAYAGEAKRTASTAVRRLARGWA